MLESMRKKKSKTNNNNNKTDSRFPGGLMVSIQSLVRELRLHKPHSIAKKKKKKA